MDEGEPTISIIDPDAGTASRLALKVEVSDRTTLTDYDLDLTNADVPAVSIADGFSERLMPRPVPEPGTGLLLSAGVLVIAWHQRRAKFQTGRSG